MMKYILYSVDGSQKDILVKEPLSLKILQTLVEGSIEFTRVPAAPEREFCVNEEGHIFGLRQNPFFPQFVGNVIEGRVLRTKEGTHFVGIV